MEVILAIDGGGSRTRCLAIDQSGRIVGQAEGGPSNHLLVDIETVKHSLAETIDQSLNSAQLVRGAVICVSAGLAGVDVDGAGADEMKELLRTLGFDRVVINGDMVIAHAGALRLHPGVIALAGTGSVILGVGKKGERVKVGGWGPIYGDEGSAYRIGEMSLRAAARAHDKRGPATALEESLMVVLEIDDFKESLTRVYAEGMEPRDIAALSRIAYRIAEAGDEVARQIFLQAGDELADSVHAAIKRLTFDEGPIVVSHQGSVIESCHMLRERLLDRLNQKVPNVVVIAPEFEPVIGAYLLGCQEVGWIIDKEMVAGLKARSKSELTVGTTTP